MDSYLNFSTNLLQIKGYFSQFYRQYELYVFCISFCYIFESTNWKIIIYKFIAYSKPWRSGAHKAKNIDRCEPKAHSILVKCKTEHIWHMQRTINISVLNESLLYSAKYTRATFYTRSIKCSRVLVLWFSTNVVWYFLQKIQLLLLDDVPRCTSCWISINIKL